ncbi:MAG: Fic family protein [Candidatus Solibacter sp.]|jgi:cell filamentation protein
MSRYSARDHYLDPASRVLRNRLGIADAATLEQAEAALVATRSYELSQTPLPGQFDLAHLQAIHRYLFGDLYEWAGQLRTIDIGKGGHLFAHHAYIGAAAGPIFKQLAEEKCLAGLGPAAFSDRAAYYLGEMNALHPFREGNGRAQREFVSHLAHAAGYYVAWENVRQPDMLQAFVESFKGDTSRLAALIRDNLHGLEPDSSPPVEGHKRKR